MILGYCGLIEAFSTVWKTNSKLEPGPNSIDVTLSNQFVRIRDTRYTIDPSDASTLETEAFQQDEIILRVGQMLLGKTVEWFDTTLPFEKANYVQMYEGRSTMARLGVGSHISAGYGDYGFSSPWTLELHNLGPCPVLLRAGMRIGQITFMRVINPIHYNGAYKDGEMQAQIGTGRV